jgi:hypothetical protein
VSGNNFALAVTEFLASIWVLWATRATVTENGGTFAESICGELKLSLIKLEAEKPTDCKQPSGGQQ